MTTPLQDFIRMFDSNLMLEESLVVKRGNRYYLLNEGLKGFTEEGFLYAGTYLGETKGGRFMPSFVFLAMIAETARNKTYIDRKTAWLFICRRDIFRRGIVRTSGATGKSNCTLIINRHDECLGFGCFIANFNEKADAVAVKNVMDIGDFLRRER